MAAAAPTWAVPANDLLDMKPFPVPPLGPIELLVRNVQDRRYFERAGVPEPKAPRRAYPPASSSTRR